MQISAFTRLGPLLLASLIVSGCASVMLDEKTNQGNPADLDQALYHTVQRGDRLSAIALTYTGSIDNWQTIAAFNGIDDPRKLQPGFELRIPAHLIPDYTDRLAAKQASRSVQKESGLDSRAATPASAAPTQVVVSAVSTNRRFDMTPISTETRVIDNRNHTAQSSTSRSTTPNRFVTVVGSYYPKGIYAQPANYSRLLHRVAPGTRLALQGQFEDWYEIVMDDGEPGYIRIVDARITDDDSVGDDAEL